MLLIDYFQKDTTHCLHMNLSNFRVWCHECHSEINFQKDSSDKENSTKGIETPYFRKLYNVFNRTKNFISDFYFRLMLMDEMSLRSSKIIYFHYSMKSMMNSLENLESDTMQIFLVLFELCDFIS